MNINLDKVKEPNASQNSPGNDIELKEYETRLEFLYDIAQQASSAAEVSDLLKEIPYVIQQILNASASSLLLIDEEERQFCLRASRHDETKTLEQIKLSLDSGIAGFVAQSNQSIIVNDVSLDNVYLKDIDGVSGLDTRSLMAAPLLRGSKVIGILEMINQKDGGLFTDRDLGLLTEFASTEALILLVSMANTLINNFKLCQKIESDYTSTVETLVSYADAKDPYAFGHSRRVKEYSMLAARALNLSPEELRLIEFGALLHDIGKIGIDDRILRKPGELTTEEWYIIRKHTLKGANIVSMIPNLEKTTDIILYHHERYDGTGYPEGLKGEQIPLGARIISVADAFDTMTTDRAYRSAINFDEAIKELLECSGKQFCPRVLEAFIGQLQEPGEGNRSAIEELMLKEKQESARPENNTIEEDKPAPEEVIILDVVKDTKQGKSMADAGNSPSAEIILNQFAEKAPPPEIADENEEYNPEAQAILERLVEKVAGKGKSADGPGNKPAVAEITEENSTGGSKPENNQTVPGKVTKQGKNKSKKETVKAGKTRGNPKRNYDISLAIFEGDVRLAIVPFISFQKTAQFKKCLLMIDGLKFVSESWSEDDGYIISIFLQAPVNLGNLLKNLADVREVYQEGRRIVVELKTGDDAKTNEPASS